MKILSINVGKPMPIVWNGETITTSIFKTPITTACKIVFNNLDGDEQSDLRVHGGADKAVYAYDIAYYNNWKNILIRYDWNFGLFGENLTTEGFTDDVVKVGNIYTIGTAKLMAVQHAFPALN